MAVFWIVVGLSVPCMGYDDIVKGGVATPEARKSQFDDHFEDMWCWVVDGEKVGCSVGVFGVVTMGGCKMLKVQIRFPEHCLWLDGLGPCSIGFGRELSNLDQSDALLFSD